MGKRTKICIDAGHGGKDPGAVSGKRREKDDALKIAKRLRKVLEVNGLDVVMTRTTDRYDSPSQKAAIGNQSGADYFVSIHRNSSDNKSAKGIEILVYNTAGKKYEMALDICRRFKSRGFKSRGFKDRGITIRTDLAVLRRTKMPAMLIELGFISNKSDNALLDEKFYTLVNDIARGIMSELGMKFRTITELKEASK